MSQLQPYSPLPHGNRLQHIGGRSLACDRSLTRCAPTDSRQRGSGYTLVELLIVLAVLSLILSLGLPSFRRLSRRADVQDSARQLRAELMRARLHAIETGRPQFFQYQPGTGSYQVVPAADANLTAAESSDPSQLDATASLSAESSTESTTLHEGVVFADPWADSGSAFAASPMTTEWSDPVIFYPNGRSHNAAFRVANDDYQVRVTLRGLTGAIRLGRLQPVVQADDEPLPDASVGF